MVNYTFPAVLTYEDDCYYVKFPDIENFFTDGDTRSEALEMANDVLALMLCDYEDRGLAIPKPTAVQDMTLAPNEEVVLVAANTAQYRSHYLKESAPTRITVKRVFPNFTAAKHAPITQRKKAEQNKEKI